MTCYMEYKFDLDGMLVQQSPLFLSPPFNADEYTPTRCTTNLALFLEPPPVEQRRITLAGRNRRSAMSLRPSNGYDKGGKRSGWRDRRMRGGQGGHRWKEVVWRNLFISP
ncbi:uncharacterized [Tachysurus ichikawai]